jgi:hypothetical protein
MTEKLEEIMTTLRTAARIACLFAALSALALGQSLPISSHPDTTGWQPLFSGDLSNAVFPPGSWVMEDGVLHAVGHDTIWTKDAYGDFVLDMEFKVAKGANSGVFLRAGDINDILSALEIQIHENTDGSRIGMVGALYDAKAPSKNVAKPAGEWNHYTITCKGSRLYLVFNGEQVLNVDLDDWTELHKNPDGTPNKFDKALKDYARKGPIGLQGIHGREGQPVWFRNLKIKALD